MKILLVNKFHYLNGGSEKYYFELGKLLKKYGNEVAYFYMKDDRNIKTGDKEYFVEKIDFKPSNIEADVLYEDECILLVNKPSGIIIHPEYKDEEKDTLVNRVANYYYHHKLYHH